jgi:ABC-type multidrug transport system fused ATPase/permease subunit
VGSLVGVSMVRELGPVLAALIFAGRVGSGIAAELGSMRVTEQIDALQSFGTDPIKKLVTPRILAGVIMLPILTIVTDAVGIFGGLVVSVYTVQIPADVVPVRGLGHAGAVGFIFGFFPRDFVSGLVKPLVFGASSRTPAAITAWRAGRDGGGGSGDDPGGGDLVDPDPGGQLLRDPVPLVLVPPAGMSNRATPANGAWGDAAARAWTTRSCAGDPARDPGGRRRAGRGPGPAEPVIELEDIHLSFDQPILKGVSLHVRKGETLLVLGRVGDRESPRSSS